MIVARRFVEVIVTAGMLVGASRCLAGWRGNAARIRPTLCEMVLRHASRAGSASTPTRR